MRGERESERQRGEGGRKEREIDRKGKKYGTFA